MGKFTDALLGGVGQAAGGLISGVTNLIGGAIDRNAQERENEKAREFQTAEREAQNQWNLDQWNRQNEYNDPIAQMDRMIAAGINPSAAAQGISGNGSTAGSVQGASNGAGMPAQLPSLGIQGLGDAIGQSANSALNGVLGIREKKLKEKDLAIKTEEEEGLKLDNEAKEQDLGIKKNEREISDRTKEERITIINETAKKAVADREMSEQQADIIMKTAPFLVEKSQQELEQIKTNIEEGKKRIEEVDQTIENLKSQRASILQSIKESKARERNLNASTALMEQQAETEEWETAKSRMDYKLKIVEKEIADLTKKREQIVYDNLRELGIDPNLDSTQKMIQAWSKVGESDDDNINVLSGMIYTCDWIMDKFGGLFGIGLVGKGIKGVVKPKSVSKGTKKLENSKADYKYDATSAWEHKETPNPPGWSNSNNTGMRYDPTKDTWYTSGSR